MIEVYGYLGSPDEGVRRAVAAAGRVVAGTRALEALSVPAERRIVLGGVTAAIEALTAYEAAGRPDGPAAVLASGDPLLYGVVRRFRAGGLSCRVHPGVSSIAAAFAAVGLPWDDAQVVSAHGHGMAPTWAACRALAKVGILTAPGHGVREIAGALADLTRWYVVAERLGESDELVRILDGPTARDITDVAEPNVVLVLAHEPGSPDALGQVGPYAGGPRVIARERGGTDSGSDSGAPGRPSIRGAAGRQSPALAQVLGRWVPILGDTVWTAGEPAEQVAAWCARTGAAVVDLDVLPADDADGWEGRATSRGPEGPGGSGRRLVPAYLPDPDLVILDDPSWLGAVTARRPRRIVLICGDEDAERTADAVDAAGDDGATVTVEHLALTDADGATATTYLTTIERPREDA